jgi:hypothetical protein
MTAFYLTDFLVRQFDAFVWKPSGLDRHPELRDMYFGHYTTLVYQAQTDDPALTEKARACAEAARACLRAALHRIWRSRLHMSLFARGCFAPSRSPERYFWKDEGDPGRAPGVSRRA